MAIASFYQRAAVAASQVIAGFDEEGFSQVLETSPVGLAMGPDDCHSQEGKAAADLAVRLLARLYPTLDLRVGEPSLAEELAALAASINPEIEFTGSADHGIVIGDNAAGYGESLYVGSDGWVAGFSPSAPQSVGKSENPFGAGLAACFAVANLFRRLFVSSAALDNEFVFDGWVGDRARKGRPVSQGRRWDLACECAFVGLGAVGNGAVWALGRCVRDGHIDLIDPEAIELSNLQRYVLTEANDVGRTKVEVADRYFKAGITSRHSVSWELFAEQTEYRSRRLLVALDSARGRRAVQASLPEWILNGWTQPGDLGVSMHGRFTGKGACLACLYMPEGPMRNEDEIVASALGVPERQQQVRELLAEAGPAPDDLLGAIGEALNIESERLEQFRGSNLQELYSVGLCGGALVPLSRLGAPRAEMHVPLPHQSTMAGLLLAASAVRAANDPPQATEVTRIDVLKPLGSYLRQPMQKRGTGCYCSDPDFLDVYKQKWNVDPQSSDTPYME